jgi:hypothetical protein
MENDIIIRLATLNDLKALLHVENSVWPAGLCASEEKLQSRIETFPEGNFVAVSNGKIVGFVCAQIVKYDPKNHAKTWYAATDNGYIKKTHTYSGDYMYGVSLSVLPFVSRIVSSKLLEATGKMAVRYNLKGGILGGRIPSYHKYATKIPVEEYVFKKNKRRKYLDPELNIYAKAHLKPIKILKDYFNDPESMNYGVLLEWHNKFHWIGKVFPPIRNWLAALTEM